jgi:hypothetical protein
MSGLIGRSVDKALIYYPATQRAAGATLLVRVRGDVETARRKLEGDLTAISPGAVDEIHKLQEFVAGNIYPFRVAYWVSSAIGVWLAFDRVGHLRCPLLRCLTTYQGNRHRMAMAPPLAR